MVRLRAFGASARHVRGVVFSVAAVACFGVATGAQQKSVKDGVYTAAQAERGIAVYRSKCASCHAPNRFTDDFFYQSFAGKPLWEMFDVISDSMPEDNPGGLKQEEYADVIAYLLKLNNFPAGETELPTDKDALSAIVMEKPGGQVVRSSGRRSSGRQGDAPRITTEVCSLPRQGLWRPVARRRKDAEVRDRT